MTGGLKTAIESVLAGTSAEIDRERCERLRQELCRACRHSPCLAAMQVGGSKFDSICTYLTLSQQLGRITGYGLGVQVRVAAGVQQASR